MCFFQFARAQKGKGHFYFQLEHKQNANRMAESTKLRCGQRKPASQGRKAKYGKFQGHPPRADGRAVVSVRYRKQFLFFLLFVDAKNPWATM